MSVSDWVLAVDFGTTSTAAAIRVDETVQRVTIDGALSMPSMVFWREGTGPPGTGRLVLGQDADEGLGLAPWCVERTPKRRIGDDVILLGDHGQVELRVTDVIGQILAKVISEAVLARGGQRPAELRLTHPARWGQLRLEKLREAAAIAGFDSPVLIPEPVAAATHFASERLAAGQHVAVYDLGGGTFDTAVLQRTGDSFALAGPPGGIEQLGGEDFDFRLYQYLCSELDDEQRQALQAPTERVWTQANRELMRNARRTKEALSRNPDYEFLLGYPINQTVVVSAERFQQLISDSITETVQELARTIQGAGLEPTDLAAIYLAGGSSKIPLIKQAIEQQLGQTPESLDDPKAVTALGAARVADAQTRRNGQPTAAAQETVVEPQPTPATQETVVEPQPTPATQETVLDPQPTPATQETVLDPQPTPATQETVLDPQPAPAAQKARVRDPQPARRIPWSLAQPAMMIGCVALVGASFLKWDQLNFWHSEHGIHVKVVFAAAWVVVLALSAFSLNRPAGLFSRLAGAAGLFFAGGVIGWPIDYTSFHPIGVGTYLGLVLAALIGAGGLIAALEPGPGPAGPSSPIGWLSRVPAAPLMLAGCVALIGNSFLHVLFGRDFWQVELSLHFKVALAGFVVAALVLSAVAIARRTVSWERLAGAAGLFAAGGVFYDLVDYTSYRPIGVGTYVGLVLALVVAVGGVSALLGAGATGSRSARSGNPPT